MDTQVSDVRYTYYSVDGTVLNECPVDKDGVIGIAISSTATVLDVGTVTYLLTFPNLRKLDLSGSMSQLADISALSKLTKLTTLYLIYTQVVDISVLAELTTLTTLSLPNCVVSGFTAIAHVDKIVTISLKILVVDDKGVESTVDAPKTIRYKCFTGKKLLTELNKVEGWYDRSSGSLTKRAAVRCSP